MKGSETSVEVTDNPEAHRFEAHVDGQLAGFVTYRSTDAAIALIHTEVLPAYRGNGVGGRLASGTLQLIRARGQRARVLCSFLAWYVERHPEYNDLVAD